MALPFGFFCLISLLVYFAIPPTVIYATLTIARSFWQLRLPSWALSLAVVLIHPLLFNLRQIYSTMMERKGAAAHGAVVVPTVKTKGFDFGLNLQMKRDLQKDIMEGYPMDLQSRFAEEYGSTFQLEISPGQKIIFTSEPDHIKAILATHFDSFNKGRVTRIVLSSLLGTGVFNSDDEMWKFHRAMTRPYFTRDRISHFENFDLHANDALNQAAARLSEGHPIDFQDLIGRFTTDSATQFLFGYDVQSLAAGLSYPGSASHLNTSFLDHPSNAFINAFTEGLNKTAQRFPFGVYWPLLEFWGDKVKPYRQIMDTYIQPVIMEALNRKGADKDAPKGDEDKHTLLDELIQQTQDPDILKDELLNMLLAGRDTTTATLTYAFYMLTEHPNVAKRLQEEVVKQVGSSSRPTYADIRDMKYLRAFINEVLRLYPVVPGNSRTSKRPVVLTSRKPGSKPYFVPANTIVSYSVFLLHRREDLWGPDATKFDPDRFLDDRLHKYLTKNPLIFLPFNTGPRICLGQQFAYQEVSFFLIRLLQRFTNFRLAPDGQPEDTKPPASWATGKGTKATDKIRPHRHLTLSVKGGLWVRMDKVDVLGA